MDEGGDFPQRFDAQNPTFVLVIGFYSAVARMKREYGEEGTI
jgi:hypothetical protein